MFNGALGSLHASDFEVLPLGWKPAEPAPGGPYLFYPLPPCRLIDTRNAPGPLGAPKLTANVPRSIPATVACSIPTDAKALSVNVTAVTPPTTGALRLYPGNFSTAPNTNVLSFSAGKTRANNAVVALATGGSGTIAAVSSITGLDLVIDVNGYFK